MNMHFDVAFSGISNIVNVDIVPYVAVIDNMRNCFIVDPKCFYRYGFRKFLRRIHAYNFLSKYPVMRVCLNGYPSYRKTAVEFLSEIRNSVVGEM